ncbi:MAG: alanine--tRNA ligase [Candidatus Omnitrophota bacterium]
MKADTLREKFLEFFKSKKHKIVEPDSLVPAGDPTVLFTPAGMNQFKKEFLGFDSGFSRAATCQRCLRTDDLDKVGKTPFHHTFFEMLGNFSFGDYFKKEAIQWAWEFLVKDLGIKEEKLWVSVYNDDAEAYAIWKDYIKVPAERIIKLGDKENFWPSEAKEKGPNGPCGPCSEIFFDYGKEAGCKEDICDPSCSCGRFAEIWNLVFTQFNRKEGGALEPLPKKNIDTGMGLERLAAVMQGAMNNFETDLFRPIIKEIVSGLKCQVSSNKEAIYAIADHIRAVTFAIYDGVLPSNEARGYVVRKLIRKSILYLRALGRNEPFLYKLVPVVSEAMQGYYPQLNERKENIAEIILSEEKNFISTLNSSDKLLKEKFAQVLKKHDAHKAGKIAFELYDTYGIPQELTFNWLEKEGIDYSKGAFEDELSLQKERSKSMSAMKGDVFGAKGMDLGIKETKFSGYKDYEVKAKITVILKDNNPVKKVSKGESAIFILERSPFYAESGGQVGDAGEIIKGKNKFLVQDTKKQDKIILHIGVVKEGSFKKNDLVTGKINIERRLSIARNHTATHILQGALRKVLGAHVKQQGSLVAEERLRFDFTHFKNISKEELNRIEEAVNTCILSNLPLVVKVKSLGEAKKEGALAFFGEKYSSKVRIISIGGVSKELCGGTHLSSTGEIGLFKITQEGSIASGIRRIEAVTGMNAYKKIKNEEGVISDISALLDVPEDKIVQELEKRIAKIRELEKRLQSQKTSVIGSSTQELIKAAKDIKGKKVIISILENADMDFLRRSVDNIKKQVSQNLVVALGTANNYQVQMVVGVTSDLTQQVDASRLIKEIAPEIGGSGGGRPDFAQAGGNRPENLSACLTNLEERITSLL